MLISPTFSGGQRAIVAVGLALIRPEAVGSRDASQFRSRATGVVQVGDDGEDAPVG